MKISRQELLQATVAVGIRAEQAQALWQQLESEESTHASFRTSHIAYYFGALIIIGAMGWFMTLGWESIGGWGIAVTALGYAALFLLVGKKFWDNADTRIPGGLLVTVAVCMAPLAIYGVKGLSVSGLKGTPAHIRISILIFVAAGCLWSLEPF